MNEHNAGLVLQSKSDNPRLWFTPTAWSQLLLFRDAGKTEVGGFGICPSNRWLVEDIEWPKQKCTSSTVKFDDNSVADMQERLVDSGLQPNQFMRVWIHTHPGSSPNPSFTDEETFERVFGACDWAIMFILAKEGKNYARLWMGEYGFSVPMDVWIAYSAEYGPTDYDAWNAAYKESVEEEKWTYNGPSYPQTSFRSWEEFRDSREPYYSAKTDLVVPAKPGLVHGLTKSEWKARLKKERRLALRRIQKSEGQKGVVRFLELEKQAMKEGVDPVSSGDPASFVWDIEEAVIDEMHLTEEPTDEDLGALARLQREQDDGVF